MINYDEFKKSDLRIEEIIEVKKDEIRIKCGEKSFSFNGKLNVEKGEKIFIVINEDKLIIPHINNSPIVPEKDINAGTKIS